MWLVATVWYHANIKHFYHYRKFFWTVLVWTLDRALANYYFCLSLGCYDRDHALDGLNELFFPQSWRLGSPGSRCKQIQYLVRSLFLVYRQPPSHCILTWWREGRESKHSHISTYKGTNPTLEDYTHMTELSPEGQTSYYHLIGG